MSNRKKQQANQSNHGLETSKEETKREAKKR